MVQAGANRIQMEGKKLIQYIRQKVRNRQEVSTHCLPVALLSSVACELAPLKIAFLCVFIFYFYLSFYTCNFCNDYVRQENTFGHWTALH